MLQTPIIAMTASVLQDEKIRCFEVGINDYMSKPFKPAELFNTVSKFLNDNLKEPNFNTIKPLLEEEKNQIAIL